MWDATVSTEIMDVLAEQVGSELSKCSTAEVGAFLLFDVETS
jgi:hypothetical protein